MTYIRYGVGLVGVIYTVLGVLGFLPVDFINPLHHEGVGARYLLNQVAVNDLHNLVHLAAGLSGVVAARSLAASRFWGRFWGTIFLLLFVVGMIQAYLEGFPRDQALLGLVPLNTPGHVLHLVTGILGLYFGFAGTKEVEYR